MRLDVSSNTFIREISRVFNWLFKTNSSRNFEECNSDVLFDAEQLRFCDKTLKTIRKGNVSSLIFAHLNINSIRNKFELLKNKFKGNIDIFMVFETIIDDNFPHSQSLRCIAHCTKND